MGHELSDLPRLAGRDIFRSDVNRLYARLVDHDVGADRDDQRRLPPVVLKAISLRPPGERGFVTVNYACGHSRLASPRTLAAVAVPDTILADIVTRLRVLEVWQH